MNLFELMSKYREITEKIINTVESGEYDYLDNLVEERGEILKNIGEGGFSKEEIKNNFNKCNVAHAEETMKQVMIKEKESLKSQMHKNLNNKRASNSYNANRSKAIFLSREL